MEPSHASGCSLGIPAMKDGEQVSEHASLNFQHLQMPGSEDVRAFHLHSRFWEQAGRKSTLPFLPQQIQTLGGKEKGMPFISAPIKIFSIYRVLSVFKALHLHYPTVIFTSLPKLIDKEKALDWSVSPIKGSGGPELAHEPQLGHP